MKLADADSQKNWKEIRSFADWISASSRLGEVLPPGLVDGAFASILEGMIGQARKSFPCQSPECFGVWDFAVAIRKHRNEPVKALVCRQLRWSDRVRLLSPQEAPKLLGVDAATNWLVEPLMKYKVIFEPYAEELLIGVLWAKVTIASAIQRRPMGRDIS